MMIQIYQTYPKVTAVTPLADKRLRVMFANDDVRIYDCTVLLTDPAFRLLHDEALFRSVQVDPHGYGVVWSDALDLSESELWLNGSQDV